MRRSTGLSLALMAAAGAAALILLHRRTADEGEPKVHVRNEFSFPVHAPMTVVAPLFGANRERLWAENWNPHFVFPSDLADGADIEGEVFTVSHDHGLHRLQATWVNTALDFANGHVAYAYVIEGVMVTRIDIDMHAPDAKSTAVHVVYERTTLSSSANNRIREMGRTDAASALEWQTQIEAALKKSGQLDGTQRRVSP